MDERKKLDSIAQDLIIMDKALREYQESYQKFLGAAQTGDWVKADGFRFLALSHMEIAMDAYTRACRLQLRK